METIKAKPVQSTLAKFFKKVDGSQMTISQTVTAESTQCKTQTEPTPPTLEEKVIKLDTEAVDYEEFKKNFNDGKRIYNNKLIFYDTYRPDMISFADLFTQHAGIADEKVDSLDKVPQNAVIASFLVEDKFLGKHVIKKGIECTIFKHGYMDTEGARGKSILDYPEVKMRCVLPDLKTKYSVFHPKVMLIKFNSFLRVVITTANMLERDWTELGQLIWFQDFPFTAEPVESPFKNDLKKFFHEILPSSRVVTVKPTPGVLKEYSDPSNAINDSETTILGRTFKEVIRGEIELEKYDFSNWYVDLVSSISGFHKVDTHEADDYGMFKIRNIMSKVPATLFNPTENTQITYQWTSFGRVYTRMLSEFVYNIMGQKLNFSNIILKERLNFIFPENKQVLDSHLGNEVNCLKLRDEFWNEQQDFPRYLFHKFDYKDEFEDYSKNVHHSKVMVITEGKTEISDSTAIYIGSHNMSGGAWGTLQRNNKVLFIGNYELGVFFKPRVGSKEIKQRIINSLAFNLDSTKYDLKVDKPYLCDKNSF